VLSGSVLRHVFAGQDEVGQAESEAEARAAKFTRLYRETLEQVADAKGRVTYFEKLFSKERKKNAVLEEKVSRLEQEIRKSKRRDRTGSIGGGGGSPPTRGQGLSGLKPVEQQSMSGLAAAEDGLKWASSRQAGSPAGREEKEPIIPEPAVPKPTTADGGGGGSSESWTSSEDSSDEGEASRQAQAKGGVARPSSPPSRGQDLAPLKELGEGASPPPSPQR